MKSVRTYIRKEPRYRRAFVVSVTVQALIKVLQSIARGERDESNQQSPTQSVIVEAKLRLLVVTARYTVIERSSYRRYTSWTNFPSANGFLHVRIFQIFRQLNRRLSSLRFRSSFLSIVEFLFLMKGITLLHIQ